MQFTSRGVQITHSYCRFETMPVVIFMHRGLWHQLLDAGDEGIAFFVRSKYVETLLPTGQAGDGVGNTVANAPFASGRHAVVNDGGGVVEQVRPSWQKLRTCTRVSGMQFPTVLIRSKYLSIGSEAV